MLLVCKKCIVEYLEENTNCPICDTLLHQSHPLLYIAHDRTLQSIVYKLVANLESDEIERQCKYYRENDLEFPTQLKEKIEVMNKKNDSKLTNIEENTNETKSTSNKVSDDSLSIHKENNYHREDEPIALSLEPLDGLQVGFIFL
jgi:polycomb group RING finger protein 3